MPQRNWYKIEKQRRNIPGCEPNSMSAFPKYICLHLRVCQSYSHNQCNQGRIQDLKLGGVGVGVGGGGGVGGWGGGVGGVGGIIQGKPFSYTVLPWFHGALLQSKIHR